VVSADALLRTSFPTGGPGPEDMAMTATIRTV
jgi:hypothetical protein